VKESNVVEMIEPAPKRFKISREEWARTPAEIRSEILRMDEEMSEGLAIAKDRRAGRVKKREPGKRVPGGFWEAWKIERSGGTVPPKLRATLAAEEADWAEMEKYHEMAEAAGTTVKAALTRYVALENLIRHDPQRGIEALCEYLDIDQFDLARRYLAEPENEVA
jgi:hypothetical protein